MKKIFFYNIIIVFSIISSMLFSVFSYSFTLFSQNPGTLLSQNTNDNKVLLMGSIQYPMELEKIPMLRIYCGGNKIKCETNDDNKKLTFAFTESQRQSQFYILITEQIEFVTENNVVLYLKVPAAAPYKLYRLERIKDNFQKQEKDMRPYSYNKLKDMPTTYRWIIEEIQLADKGKIPDNAIIICDEPSHLAMLSGDFAGSDQETAYELPKIVMRSDLLRFVGSEKKLHEQADRLRLAAIDSDTIHSWRQNIKSTVNQKAKSIVALTS